MKSLQVAFQVASLEVWGCGGREATRAQQEQRERVEGVREQARKVDRARLCENDFDKEMPGPLRGRLRADSRIERSFESLKWKAFDSFF